MWLVSCGGQGIPSKGQAKIEYADHASESLTFTLFTGKRPQSIPTLSTSPPKFPLKKIREEAKSIKTCPSAPHTVKGFADDITIISPSVPAHNCALKETDKKASSLDLRLKPENACHFFLMERILTKSPLSCSPMVPLEISQKVLGHLLAVSPTCSRKASAKKLEGKLFSAIKNIDSRPIRGELKIWILKNYLVPSLHFLLMVDLVLENSLASIQQKLIKYRRIGLSGTLRYSAHIAY